MPQSQYSKPWTLVDGGSKAESPVSYINIFIQCHSYWTSTPQPAQHGYFVFPSEAQALSTFIFWRLLYFSNCDWEQHQEIYCQYLRRDARMWAMSAYQQTDETHICICIWWRPSIYSDAIIKHSSTPAPSILFLLYLSAKLTCRS